MNFTEAQQNYNFSALANLIDDINLKIFPRRILIKHIFGATLNLMPEYFSILKPKFFYSQELFCLRLSRDSCTLIRRKCLNNTKHLKGP